MNFYVFFLDQLESEQTSDQAVHDFLRLYSTNQMANSLFTNHITYDDFLSGFHVVAYDLTSAQDSGSTAFTSPSVRVGKYFSQIKKMRERERDTCAQVLLIDL